MIGEIIAIGDELTNGRILNTTSGFAARELFVAGYEIYAMHTIGDTEELIGEALKRAIGRVDFVIVTGGLGSTTDDLTNEAVFTALNRPATFYPEILGRIRSHLHKGDENCPTALEKMAWLPEGSEVLNSHARMAGYQLVHDNTPIFFLPGVPYQMKELLVDQVLPRLASWPENNRNHVRQGVFKVFGINENEVNKRLLTIEKSGCCKVGYYPVDSEVHVSLTIFQEQGEGVDDLFDQTSNQIREALGSYCYGTNHDSMASVVGNILRKREKTLATAESCTGGLIGSTITRIPGSSDWFVGGVITYSNNLKELFLDVPHEMLLEHGAVSAPVARAMARGIVEKTGADIGISVTGIAGPSGGSQEKPVGTVYMGLAEEGIVNDYLVHLSGSRQQIQEKTTQTLLDKIRRLLL